MSLTPWTRILNDLDSAGRGRKRDKEEEGTRRKEGRGGGRDEESEKIKKVVTKMKMKKSLKDASLASLGLVHNYTSDGFMSKMRSPIFVTGCARRLDTVGLIRYTNQVIIDGN